MTLVSDVIKWTRRLLKTPNTQDISDATIIDYINRFYIYDVPARIQLFDLKTQYSFETTANVDRYNSPIDVYSLIQGPAFCDGVRIDYFQGPSQFGSLYNLQYFNRDSSTGTGIQGPYTFTLPSAPFIRGFTDASGVLSPAFYVTATDNSGNQLVINDDGGGNLIGDGIGTINYVTGAVSVTFNASIPSTSTIRTQTVPYVAGRPTEVMFFNNTFTLRAVPDKAYLITLVVNMTPAAFLATGESVIFAWLGEYLAHGAARKIMKDNGDMEQLQMYEPFFKEQEAQVLRRTTRQNSTQRSASIFAAQTSNQSSNQWWY